MNLTDEQLRIAIAECCGWKWYRRPAIGPWASKPMRALYHPSIHTEYISTLTLADMTERQCNAVFIWREGMIPDYINDLNAMHGVEETLSGEEIDAYANLIINPTSGPHWRFNCVHANATQRARAFLKVKGVEL